MFRPNYYLLLELDCGEKSTAKIEAAIIAKQAEWSRDRNHPKKGREAQQYLGLLTDIRKVMGNAEDREKESRECRELRQQAEKAAYADLDRHIGTVAARGHLFESEVAQLVQQFKGRFIEAEIRKRIKVPIRKDSRPEGASRPELDTSTAKEIENRLKIIAKKDLYDFLDLPQSTSHDQLLNRARELDSDARKNNNKSAEVTAQAELAGFCLRVFKSEEERERYDNTLAMCGLREMDGQIRMAGASKKIDARAMESLLKEAGSRGVTPDEARAYICAFASKQGWAVEVPHGDGPDRVHACGACGVINATEATVCASCGEPLWIACPSCQTRNASETVICPRCGFKVGNAALVRRMERDAQRSLGDGDFTAAERYVREAEELWNDSPSLRKLRDQLHEHKLQNQERLQKNADTAKKLQDAMIHKRFAEAQALVIDVAHCDPNYAKLNEYRGQIEKAINEAHGHVDRARLEERNGRIDEAVNAYGDALRACDDYPDAQRGLEKHPPKPPANLRAVALVAGIDLNWQATPSRGPAKYVVVRKTGAPPVSHTDGKEVAVTSATNITDADAPSGQPVFYAVYTDRGGVLSSSSAASQGVVRLAEVGELTATSGENRISLNWRLPGGVQGIEVWRNSGDAPRARNEGASLHVPGVVSTCVDDKLKNGTLYGYRVITVFRGINGESLYSQGVTCEAIPSELPKVVNDLSVTQDQGELRATWTPPSIGTVHVYATPAKIAYSSGQSISLVEAEKIGRRVPAVSNREIRDKLNNIRLLYLVPVTVSGTTAVVGQQVLMSCLGDVQDLRVQVRDGRLIAQWQWPADCSMVSISLRTDTFSTGPEDSRIALFTRHHYEHHGKFEHDVPQSAQIYLTVYAALKDGVGWVYASGTGSGARRRCEVGTRQTVLYWVRGKGDGGAGKTRFELLLKADSEITLPALILVGKPEGLPLAPTNGTVVLNLPNGTMCAEGKRVSLAFKIDRSDRFWRFRLFAVNECDNQWLELMESDKLGGIFPPLFG
ncbi:MAG: zinc ribbon domain-containing protein [Planctomycetota bacterium]